MVYEKKEQEKKRDFFMKMFLRNSNNKKQDGIIKAPVDIKETFCFALKQ